MDLEIQAEQVWRRDLGFYMGEVGAHRDLELDRGFPWLCSMNAYLFLEQGEHILTNVAPLRGISFFPDPDGDPFPAKQLAQSPLLGHLDEIRFVPGTLRDGDLELLLASPYLTRTIAWDVRINAVSTAAWEAFATYPLARRALQVATSYKSVDGGPLGEVSGRFDIYPCRHFDISAEARELEAKYGYLPWLHKSNLCHTPDAHYWMEQHVLPMYVPGSPAHAPLKYGTGLGAQRSLEPRESFDANIYNTFS